MADLKKKTSNGVAEARERQQSPTLGIFARPALRCHFRRLPLDSRTILFAFGRVEDLEKSSLGNWAKSQHTCCILSSNRYFPTMGSRYL